MNYRILPMAEWEKLLEILPPESIPAPEVAGAAVAEDESGAVQGVLMLQLAFHVEPLVIKDSHVDFRRLVRTIEESLQDRKGLVYYVFVPDEKIRRMAEIVDFKPTGWEVWKKEV